MGAGDAEEPGSGTGAGRDSAQEAAQGDYDFVVVANRLPVDRVEAPDGGLLAPAPAGWSRRWSR